MITVTERVVCADPLAPPAPERAAAPVAGVSAAVRSYRTIVTSSALIGGSSALNVLIGMLRSKAMAMLLGPAGFGLMGAYTAVQELARTLATMGLNQSGVRQIAAAVGTGDHARIALVVAVLRRTSIACGLAGGLLLAAFARPVALLTFGDDAHAGGVALLGVAVFLSTVANGQAALLQGMRRVGDLARLTLAGGLAGLVVGVPLVWRFGEAGVAPTLVAIAGAATLVSWRYARRVRVDAIEGGAPVAQAGPREPGALAHEAWAMLRLGAAFMASGLLTMGAAYAVRILVLRHEGLAGAGVYQAAWTVGGVYIGFVLQSLGTDFYPRLTAATRDPVEANRLVNEQTRVGLLIALPGVLATITLAPLALQLLYSDAFTAAAGTLRWFCIGMAMRVLTWPMGFIPVALNRRRVFVATELAWVVANVSLALALIPRFGVDGAGMAFAGAYAVHAVLLLPIARWATGFAFTRENVLLMGAAAATVAAVCGGFLWLPALAATLAGAAVTAVATFACARAIVTLVAPERLPRVIAACLRIGGRG